MKMVDIKDIGIKYVLLPRGKYLIGDEVVQIDGYYDKKVQIRDCVDVRKITETTVVTKYVKGEEEMSIDTYEELKSKLLKNRIYNDYDEVYEWEDLESEFEYKKLTTYWKPIYKSVQEFSDPLKVMELKEIEYNTGNKYIKNLFFNGDKNGDISLYIYDRPRAREEIVYKIFKELGFEYEHGISHWGTEGKKVWGNSSHSVIRYVVAFGKYIFNDSWGSEVTPRGTLEDLKKMYEDDYNSIKKIIMTHYNRTFGKIDEKNFDFVKLLDNLSSLKNTITSIDSKVKTQGYRTKAINKVIEIIDDIDNRFK